MKGLQCIELCFWARSFAGLMKISFMGEKEGYVNWKYFVRGRNHLLAHLS